MCGIADIDGLSINGIWSIKTFRDEDMHQPFVGCDTFINSVNWKIRKSDVTNTVLYNLPCGLLLLNYYRQYRYLVTIRKTYTRSSFSDSLKTRFMYERSNLSMKC